MIQDKLISAPTNLQNESLWQEIITSIKQYGQTGKKEYNENCMILFYDMKTHKRSNI